jgi:hypothetical protein
MLQDSMMARPEPRTCRHSEHGQNGSKLAGGQMPPAHLLKAGCETGMWDGVPLS